MSRRRRRSTTGSPSPGRSTGRERQASLGEYLLHRAGAAVIGAKLMLVPIVFDTLGEDAFGIPKLVVSRALLYVLASIAVAYLLSSREARSRVSSARAMLFLIGVVAAAAGVSTLLSTHPWTAVFGAHHRYLGLASLLDGMFLAFTVVLFVRAAVDLRVMMTGLIGGATVVAAYALVQALRIDPIPWTAQTLISTIGNTGALAGYLTVVVATSATLGALTVFQVNATRLFLAGLATVAAGLVVLSAARGPLLALIVLAPSVAILILRARPALYGAVRRYGVVIGAGASAALIGSLVLNLPRLRALTASDSSLAERSLIYSAAQAMLAASPVWGAGPDHFAVLFPRLRPPSDLAYQFGFAAGQTSAHSWFLQKAVDLGLVGSVALAALVVVALLRGWRAAPRPDSSSAVLGAAMIVAFLLQGAFNITHLGTEFLFWAGVGLCATGPLAPHVPARHLMLVRRDRFRHGGRLAVALLVGLGLASTTQNVAMANREVRTADLLRSAGKFEAAQRSAMSAVSRDGGRANNWNVLGLALSPTDPRAALSAFERAHSAAPFESRYLINMVKEADRLVQRDATYLRRMVEYAERAVDADPRNPEPHVTFSFALLRGGDVLGAQRHADQAIELSPRDPRYHSWAAAIYEQTGEPAVAARRYESYLALAAGGSPATDQRAHLARLYRAAGAFDRAANTYPPPRATSVIRPCESLADPAGLPWCFAVTFTALESLPEDPTTPQAVTRPGNYLIDGRELPGATRITYDRSRGIAVIELPRDLVPPAAGAKLSVRGIADQRGFALEPDPTVLSMPASLYLPPRALTIGRSCQGVDPAGAPWCFTVTFSGTTDLVEDPSIPAAVTRVANYAIDGVSLHPDSRIRYDRVSRTARIELARVGAPPTSGSMLMLRGVSDQTGSLIDPNPTFLRFP